MALLPSFSEQTVLCGYLRLGPLIIEWLMHDLKTLLGHWHGRGVASFPTIPDYPYQETLHFQERDGLLAYEQKTVKFDQACDLWLPSHWEFGFIRILEGGQVEVNNCQNGGRVEWLLGTLNREGVKHKLELTGRGIGNDPRVQSHSRRWVWDGKHFDVLMWMGTNKNPSSTMHLKARLTRKG